MLRGLSTGGFSLFGELQVITLLSLGGRNVSEGFQESLVLEPR